MWAQAGAWAYATLAAGAVGFHAAAILGAPVGRLTMGGRWPGVLPAGARILSALSAALIVLAAAALLARVGALGRPAPDWAAWAVVAVSVLAVLSNAATPSRPERRLWLPVGFAMLAASLAVALS